MTNQGNLPNEGLSPELAARLRDNQTSGLKLGLDGPFRDSNDPQTMAAAIKGAVQQLREEGGWTITPEIEKHTHRWGTVFSRVREHWAAITHRKEGELVWNERFTITMVVDYLKEEAKQSRTTTNGRGHPQERVMPENDAEEAGGCRRCGQCCMTMEAPPFIRRLRSFKDGVIKEEPMDAELRADQLDFVEGTPQELINEVMEYMQLHGDIQFRSIPCYWLDQETMLCKHHEFRPPICREHFCPDCQSGGHHQ